MPTIPVDAPEALPVEPYAGTTDVLNQLGSIRDTLPSWVVLDEWIALAHATVVDVLAKTYGGTVPAFTGPGELVVRFAEAKIAAAEILHAIRVNLGPEMHEVPDELRAAAIASLVDGVPGYPLDDGTVIDDDGDPTTEPVVTVAHPLVSSYTPASAFPDPYAELRGIAGLEKL